MATRSESARSEIAHRLKNPLSVITGYAELLRIRDDEETRERAPMQIIAAAERLLAEIDAVLDDLHPPRPSVPAAGLRRRRILLVDDDDDLRTLVRLTFPADEFEIVEAATGTEGVSRAGSDCDLVVLDWDLPDIDGGEVLRRVKSDERAPPVVVLTAHAESEIDAARADAFIAKPFKPVQLLDVVSRLLSID